VRFGYLSHVWRKPGMTPAARYAQLWRELALCDDAGFDAAYTIEHHDLPAESLSPSPAMFIASAAAHTRRMRLGAMGWLAPTHNPLRVVDEVTALDHVTNGRLDVGLVAGYAPHQLGAFGIDYAERRPRTIECYELLKTACASPERFSFEGPFHRYTDVALQVPPLQEPHPPVWIESVDPGTLAYLAREGINTGYVLYMLRDEIAPLYREYLRLWEKAGHARRPDINYWTLVYVDETDDKAWEVAGPHWLHVYEKLHPMTMLIESRRQRKEHRGEAWVRGFTDLRFVREHDAALIGSPATVAAKIRQYAREGVFNTLIGEFNFGAMDEDDLMRSIRLFAGEVIPSLRPFDSLGRP
jgi:alkanesulfonate monooxygenase SsuD/methylene tetrahydromethanopterin reductase-like flavin-dependent oxidoreductase (luciferase family)